MFPTGDEIGLTKQKCALYGNPWFLFRTPSERVRETLKLGRLWNLGANISELEDGFRMFQIPKHVKFKNKNRDSRKKHHASIDS